MISDFYLRYKTRQNFKSKNPISAFLNSVRENGYIIFVVQGDYPQYDRSVKLIENSERLKENSSLEKLLPIKDGLLKNNVKVFQRIVFIPSITFKEMNERNLKKKNYKLNIGGTDERDLEEAIQNSLKEAGGKAGLNQGINEFWI